MDFSNAQRAEVLTQALPYIKRYNGKIVVIKYGGNAMINEQLKQQVMEDIALLWLIGVKVVLVHGGGPEISETMKKLGKEAVFVDGLRVTDKETVDIVQMVLAGKVNKSLVTLLQMKGGHAVGLSGMDGGILEAKIKDERLGFVGEIVKVRTQPITDLLEKNYIPVISTVASDHAGNAYNINGDTAAAYIAGALGAERLIMMTDIAGILRDKDDPSTLIPELTVSEAKALYDEGVISGGMIPKVDCCIEALEKGVENVIIMDGRVSHSILMELLTDEGAGTMVTGDECDEYETNRLCLYCQYLRAFSTQSRAGQRLARVGRERQGIYRPLHRHRGQHLRYRGRTVGGSGERTARHAAAYVQPLLHRPLREARTAVV